MQFRRRYRHNRGFLRKLEAPVLVIALVVLTHRLLFKWEHLISIIKNRFRDLEQLYTLYFLYNIGKWSTVRLHLRESNQESRSHSSRRPLWKVVVTADLSVGSLSKADRKWITAASKHWLWTVVSPDEGMSEQPSVRSLRKECVVTERNVFSCGAEIQPTAIPSVTVTSWVVSVCGLSVVHRAEVESKRSPQRRYWIAKHTEGTENLRYVSMKADGGTRALHREECGIHWPTADRKWTPNWAGSIDSIKFIDDRCVQKTRRIWLPLLFFFSGGCLRTVFEWLIFALCAELVGGQWLLGAKKLLKA